MAARIVQSIYWCNILKNEFWINQILEFNDMYHIWLMTVVAMFASILQTSTIAAYETTLTLDISCEGWGIRFLFQAVLTKLTVA